MQQIAAMPQENTPKLGGIVDRAPADLKPWPGNPRTHSTKQLAKLKTSIQRFGFTIPVLTDESGTVLAGHGRVQAAAELGLPTVATRVLSGLTEAQKRAYVLADNKIAELSKWDDVLLREELELLIQADFEVETTGFSTAEIDLMLDAAGKPVKSDPDDLQAGDIPKVTVTRPGDLWELGAHRLFCGNALECESYKTVLAGEFAQMVVTDPPYNVKVDGHVCGSGKIKHKEFAMASGEMSEAQFTEFLQTAFAHLHGFSESGAISFVFMDWRHLRELLDAARPVFGEPRQLCVWAKDNAGLGSFYRSQHELVFVFKKGDASHINNFELGQHGRYRTNVWNYPSISSMGAKGHELLALHPTVKPTSLVSDAIRDCSHRQGIVLDAFAGSGTILVAAERTGRKGRAIELDPHFVDIAIQRWQRVTGMQGTLRGTGQSWNELRAERLASTKVAT